MSLLEKIRNHSAVVGVVGLGYVGLPLAVLQAKTGFRVYGIDEVAEKVERINRGENYISDVEDQDLRDVVNKKQFTATSDFSTLGKCDIVLICVPTPVNAEQGARHQCHSEGHQRVGEVCPPGYARGLGEYDLPGDH